MLAPVEFRMRQKMRWLSAHRLADGMAIASACLFIFLAAYRIQLPGLYYDELAFVNAAQGGADNTFIHMRLGSVPFLIFPYMGALKAWIYAPVFRFFGVSALTIRLPAILLAAVTLLIFLQTLRAKLGAVWATIAVWILAVDPVNLFPSRLDWGPTVLTHFFQAAILALWFSYRDKPRPRKIVLICICAGSVSSTGSILFGCYRPSQSGFVCATRTACKIYGFQPRDLPAGWRSFWLCSRWASCST